MMSRWDLVLRLKGWQVFLLLQIAAVICCAAMFRSPLPPESEGGAAVTGFGLALAVFEFAYFGWLLTVGQAMNSRLPERLKRGTLLPSVGFMIAVGYTLFADQWLSSGAFEGPYSCVFVALHFVLMFVNLYILWFACRSLVAAEEDSILSLDRVLGIFFALCLTLVVPVAAWWVQNSARRVAGLEHA
jgi:hypothetical protein